jgi:hypothetical protein
MKSAINFLLAVISPFAAVPTGWAIYAGLTDTPAFPMNVWAACIGAIAVVTTTAAAAMLVVDIMKHNQEAQDETEQKTNLPAWYGWAILVGCIAAEILLTLLIVIIPGALPYGVLAFPVMTLAGAFAFALRMTLGDREQGRSRLRAKLAQEAADRQAKIDAETAEAKAKADAEATFEREQRALDNALRREVRRTKRTTADKSEQIPAPVAQVQAILAQSVAPTTQYPRTCGINGCTYPIKNAQSVGGHMKAQHKAALGIFEPVQAERK